MRILVDADACPVKESIIKIAKEFNLPVTLVQSFSHFSTKEEPQGVETIYVDMKVLMLLIIVLSGLQNKVILL